MNKWIPTLAILAICATQAAHADSLWMCSLVEGEAKHSQLMMHVDTDRSIISAFQQGGKMLWKQKFSDPYLHEETNTIVQSVSGGEFLFMFMLDRETGNVGFAIVNVDTDEQIIWQCR
jgi:hypothetical protein